MRMLAPSRIIVAAAALCLLAGLLAGAVLAQQVPPTRRASNAPPKPSGATPRTAGGHPDLTGVWNGLGDNLNGVPNQIANKIKGMKIGDSFRVCDESKRTQVLQAAKLCRRFGYIQFKIQTSAQKKGGFVATAIPE